MNEELGYSQRTGGPHS